MEYTQILYDVVDHVATVRQFFVDVIDPEDLAAIGRAFTAIAEQVDKAR